MPFPRNGVTALLIACHRRCCICHRFCGVKIETDHIVPSPEGGPDTIDNAIPVCFECHAEIHSYNDQHPRGRKFLPEELQGHKQQWLEICRTHTEVLIQSSWSSDVGPLQALIDELEFNKCVAEAEAEDNIGCLFIDDQFRRAIRDGAISTLNDVLKMAILEAYRSMGRANQLIDRALEAAPGTIHESPVYGAAMDSVAQGKGKIQEALSALVAFLSSTG
ncbi:MAG TPA: HNH endonuclease signature motif containing protein [Blastocatellia bacterium]|nr:HNH endonuclease signature motif containing protein [Blastocatellia bacterium]